MEKEVPRYQFDRVEVRPASLEVLREGRSLSLEPKAFRVLLYLIQHRERAVSKEELIEAVWEGVAVSDNALTRIVAQLRRELGDDARQARYILTLPTLGYRFIADLSPASPAAMPQPPPRWRPLAWVVVGAAMLTLAGASWWINRRSVRPSPSLRPVQLTTSPGLDSGASFSPDGGRIAYSSNRSGQFEIYTRSVDPSGSENQITSDGSQNIEPAWSPDGKWIAYHSVAHHGLWVVPSTGGAPRQITAFGSSPAWSPRARQIVFRSLEPYSFAPFDLAGLGDSTIWTVAADGSGLRQLTSPRNPPGQHAGPNWSPDGKHLIFAALGNEATLWTINATGSDLRMLPSDDLRFRAFPIYAPDGRGIFFVGPSHEGGAGIFYQALSGDARPMEIYPVRQDVPLQIAVSPDGGRLLVTRSAGVSQLWLASPKSLGPKPLYEDAVVRAKLPVFSPDGLRLAYVAQRAGSNQDIWMMNANGSGARAVAAEPGVEDGPFWNADGSAILYSYSHSGGLELRRIRPGEASAQVLLRSQERFYRPQVTPDEKEVIYETGQPVNIWTRPLKGGPARQLTFDREGASFHTLSPDGRWIAYEAGRGDDTQIVVMDRNNGQQKQLTSDPGHHWCNSWASDNRRIAFSAFLNGVWNLYWIDRVTRERKQITHYTAYGSFVRSPAWRPGSEEIVYEYSQVKGNVYLLGLANCCR